MRLQALVKEAAKNGDALSIQEFPSKQSQIGNKMGFRVPTEEAIYGQELSRLYSIDLDRSMDVSQ